ncbi:hypothetical protein EGW08_023051 [Elysia chlorotica]|uniref:Glutamate synthase domain-containing protein n=1 Tax=Elysia chlorotica TaxID=188477 RepID=A0A3S1B0V7_ELYCH|nr:hypothetical protein EGW08_023051 [Elysia chlorotica]
MLCIASEDIGNADPNALRIAIDAWNAFEKLGMPEDGEFLLDAIFSPITYCEFDVTDARVDEVATRVKIGGPDCTKPYMASHLNISAMSFGALSGNAIMALNKGAALGGFYHNTGEGGLTEYHLQGGDVVYQIGTGYFSCRTADGKFSPEKFAKNAAIDSIKMIEIKLSQGAKPSHGGVLPAAKITEEIAKIRGVEMGKDVLSPPTHSAFSTPLEFCYFIKQVRELAEGKPVGFKLCIGSHTEFLAICKAMLETGIKPDFITVDGAAGGTGAAPMEFANHIGVIAYVIAPMIGDNAANLVANPCQPDD